MFHGFGADVQRVSPEISETPRTEFNKRLIATYYSYMDSIYRVCKIKWSRMHPPEGRGRTFVSGCQQGIKRRQKKHVSRFKHGPYALHMN